MNVNFWQILCFLAVVIGATFVVFPTQRNMLPYLIDNGHYAEAGAIIDTLLKKEPRDATVVDEAVRLYLLQGLPDQAIDRLETLRRQSPLSTDRLEKLARLYEWGRQPAKARTTWEHLLKKAPDDQTALMRLIGYYRYGGDSAKEASAITRLVRLQRAAGGWQDKGNRLTDLIAAQLNQLGQAPAQEPMPPLTAMLVSGLYQLYEQELSDPATGDRPAPELLRCLEQFVWTGHLELGEAFASRADHLWQTGIDQQMRMVDVLRWSQMDQEALDLVKRLHEKAPEDRRILVAMAETAAAASDPATGIAAYKALMQWEPTEPAYRQRLMALYRQTGQSASLFDEYKRQFDATADPQLISTLLNLAAQSGDPRLQQRALDLAARADLDDPATLKLRADLYLALNQSDNAYPLLKRIATMPPRSAADLEAMIRVAGYTNQPAIIADALSVAEKERTDNSVLLNQIANGWLAAGRPEKAYAAMRRLSKLNGNPVADLQRTLDMAGQTGDPHLIEDAIAWAMSLAPDDRAISERATTLYLAIGQTDRAYACKARLVRSQRAVDQIPALVTLAESTGRPELLTDALQIGMELTPNNADLELRLARLHLAQAGQPQAIEAFERYLRLRPDDRAVQKQLATVYEWQHQPQKALAIYQRILRNHSDDTAAAAALTRLMAETGDREGLLRLAIKQADADPQSADLALAAGRALVAEGRLAAGGNYLERAAALAPERPVIWQELANVYEWTGQSDRLIDALKHLADADRLDQRQTILLAETYLKTKRFADAAALLRPIEKETVLPRREGLMLTDAYAQSDHHEAARHLIERLLEENRGDPVFLADLGQRAQWQQRWDLALSIYEAVLRQAPHNLKALKGSGQIYAWTNQPQQAIQALEAYNRLYPKDYETQYLLGELYMAAHREADAEKQYRKAMKLINAGRMKSNATGATSPGEQAQP